MAGRNDLAGLIRGLDLVRRALVESQGKELRHMWDNSSLKSAAEGVGAKVQENMSKGGGVSDVPVSGKPCCVFRVAGQWFKQNCRAGKILIDRI